MFFFIDEKIEKENCKKSPKILEELKKEVAKMRIFLANFETMGRLHSNKFVQLFAHSFIIPSWHPPPCCDPAAGQNEGKFSNSPYKLGQKRS